ncbi:hypothetical protein MNEG_15443, partial [Monoraphidium neglectum]
AYERDYAGMRTAQEPQEFVERAARVMALQAGFPQIGFMVGSDPRLLLNPAAPSPLTPPPHRRAARSNTLLAATGPRAQRPAEELERQLVALRTELEAVLPPDGAAHFVANSLRLFNSLQKPHTVAKRVGELLMVYHDVLGKTPPARAIACRSSHILNSPSNLRHKLESLVQLLGRDQTHAAICRSPHLLASKAERLSTNAALFINGIVRANGADVAGAGAASGGGGGGGGPGGGDVQDAAADVTVALQKLLSRQPRLLSTQPETLVRNYALLKWSLGATDEQCLAVVRGYPAVLTLSRMSLTNKPRELQELLQLSKHALLKIVRQQPTLLGNTLG